MIKRLMVALAFAFSVASVLNAATPASAGPTTEPICSPTVCCVIDYSNPRHPVPICW